MLQIMIQMDTSHLGMCTILEAASVLVSPNCLSDSKEGADFQTIGVIYYTIITNDLSPSIFDTTHLIHHDCMFCWGIIQKLQQQ